MKMKTFLNVSEKVHLFGRKFIFVTSEQETGGEGRSIRQEQIFFHPIFPYRSCLMICQYFLSHYHALCQYFQSHYNVYCTTRNDVMMCQDVRT